MPGVSELRRVNGRRSGCLVARQRGRLRATTPGGLSDGLDLFVRSGCCALGLMRRLLASPLPFPCLTLTLKSPAAIPFRGRTATDRRTELTQEIISALKIKLSAPEKARVTGGGTTNVDAHDFFLRGRELVIGNKRDREMFAQANVYLRRAIELDPNYAGPYAALSWAYIMDYQNHWSDSPQTSLDHAERLIDEAIAKDDNDPFVHYVAALLGLWKKDYDRWAHEADRSCHSVQTTGTRILLEA
jgi:hypothetical protein